MTLVQALCFGIIQGLTEFIPVSSTAHLLMGQFMLGIPSTDSMFSFQVIIQMGTVLALLVFFRHEFLNILSSAWEGLRAGRPFEGPGLLGWLVVLATLPALVAGYLLKDLVQAMFGNPLAQAGVRLLMSGALLGTVELLGRHTRTLVSLSWRDALTVGAFQVLAVFPGASRSGATIAGALSRGFDRPSAARFALLMSVPILVAAGLHEATDVIAAPGTTAQVPALLTGFVAAAAVGWLAIRWLMGYLLRHSLFPFATYCAILGSALLLYVRAN